MFCVDLPLMCTGAHVCFKSAAQCTYLCIFFYEANLALTELRLQFNHNLTEITLLLGKCRNGQQSNEQAQLSNYKSIDYCREQCLHRLKYAVG